ncbi:MAG TPA: hypothetical protein VH089_07730 [Streptosporangiaceae bacterium]|nr:hypothetical protein [Streptosporangiaceae bacterium]
MKKRALRIAVPVVVACLVAGSIVAFFVGNGSLSGGEWKTAAGVSLQLPAAGSPKLVFTAQPATGQSVQAGGGVFTVTVAIEDSHGTTLTSDSTDTITLALGRNPGHGVLSCTSSGGLTAPVDLGRATFSGCSISKPGIGYRLTARSSVKPALAPPANGHTFAVLSAAAKAAAKAARTTALKVTQAGGRNQATGTGGPATGPGAGGGPNPGSTPPGAGLGITSPAVSGAATASPDLGPITVELVTAGGAPTTAGVTVQLSSNSTGASEFSATAGGSPVTSVVIPPGESAATFYYGDEATGQPVITAAAAGVSAGTQTETVTAGPAAGLTFTDASTGNGRRGAPAQVTCAGTVGDSFSCTARPAPPRGKARFLTARLVLIDQFQNPVTNSSGSDIDVTLSPTGGSSVSPGSVSIPAGASSSDPFTENLGGGQGPGTVSASAAVGPGQVTASLTS